MREHSIKKHLLVLNVVGLSPCHLGKDTPNLTALAKTGCTSHIHPQLPAVTSSVQATYLTGALPKEHGIVANGWFMRELSEIRFWHQSNHLLQGKQIWNDIKTLDPQATSANMFWWYNMYCPADIAVTVRPMYPADGRKIPDIYTAPAHLRSEINNQLGQFPLFNFWGPNSNINSSKWIANCAKSIFEVHKPNLTMVYLPHLDYCSQKSGPHHPTISSELQQIDSVCGDLIQAAREQEADVVVLSEYGIQEVTTPVHLNRLFRQQGWLSLREELGLELLDAGASKVFAVADHQVAHIYIQDQTLFSEVCRLLEKIDDIHIILDDHGKKQYGLDHPRSGELIVIAKPHAWFTYYYWLEDKKAPDFARTVEIHRKPGFDPVELFIDPQLKWPKSAILWRLLKKKLGFRTLLDVIPLDATLVKGSHGARPVSEEHGAIFISSNQNALTQEQQDDGLPAIQVKQTLLDSLLLD